MQKLFLEFINNWYFLLKIKRNLLWVRLIIGFWIFILWSLLLVLLFRTEIILFIVENTVQDIIIIDDDFARYLLEIGDIEQYNAYIEYLKQIYELEIYIKEFCPDINIIDPAADWEWFFKCWACGPYHVNKIRQLWLLKNKHRFAKKNWK